MAQHDRETHGVTPPPSLVRTVQQPSRTLGAGGFADKLNLLSKPSNEAKCVGGGATMDHHNISAYDFGFP